MAIGFSAVFISLAIAGILFFLSPVSAEARAEARDRVSGAISGLLLLVLTYLIVVTINPQLNSFKPKDLSKISLPAIKIIHPGVSFYTSAGCPDKDPQLHSASIADLGPLKKQINSAQIIQDSDSGTYYISILYENPNFWGKCQYIDPNSGCQKVDPFASSASIHEYNNNSASGGGIYFYRKSCFNCLEAAFL
jgi:hypothetical protein